MTSRWTVCALWIALTASCTAIATYLQWASAVTAFERDAATVYRLVSQRVDQHDAHMTALSALAATGEQSSAGLKAVATNIAQFYPRIIAVDVIAMLPDVTLSSSSRSDITAAPIAMLVAAARLSASKSELIAKPEMVGRYVLIKLLSADDTIRHVVALEIDAKRLIETELASDFSRIELLEKRGGQAIYTNAPTGSPAPMGWGAWTVVRLDTTKVLASTSQPLHLTLSRDVSIATIIPWAGVGLSGLITGVMLLLLRAIVSARRAERNATRMASASAQEARLAHATRINAMGELSLAIAHELAQPLAALLSQSQAGLRIARSTTTDQAAIVQVLETNERLAKRAGDLLRKLRDWISVDTPTQQDVNLNVLISEIAALNQADLARHGIEIRLALAPTPPFAAADVIGIEQVVQNLIANARDACTTGAIVTIATFATPTHVGFSVADEGAGIADGMFDRMFEPFMTSKSNGMGLGLSICRRLVEKFGGDIRAANRDDRRTGAVMTVRLPLYYPGGSGN